MNKKVFSLITLAFYAIFLTSCSSSGILPRNEAVEDANLRLIASKLPEVMIMTKAMGENRAKIMRLDSEKLKVLPYPYWNTEVLEIPLENVLTIKVLRIKSTAGSMGLAGLTLGFIVTGGLIGAGAKYKEDYQDAYSYGFLIGGGAGLIGGLVGGVIDLSKKKTYKFFKMTRGQKLQALMNIMGL